LHAFYAERDRTENHESSAVEGHPVIGAGHRAFSAALGSDAVQVEPDPKLGGAVNLVRPTLADAERLHAAQRATAEQRASFETFTARTD
jgi:hypothetical protein